MYIPEVNMDRKGRKGEWQAGRQTLLRKEAFETSGMLQRKVIYQERQPVPAQMVPISVRPRDQQG